MRRGQQLGAQCPALAMELRDLSLDLLFIVGDLGRSCVPMAKRVVIK